MRPGKLTWACLAASGLLFSSARAQAQPLGLGDWSGSARLRAEVARNDSGALPVNTHSTILEERFTLKTDGVYVYDPRLVALSLEGTGAFAQNWAMAPGTPDFWKGPLWGYDVSARLLAQKPLSILAYAIRSESILAPSISAGMDHVAERRGVALLANRLFVPSTLTYRQEATRQKPLVMPGPGVKRDELKNIVEYEGQRGWTDSQVDVGYTFTDSWDRAYRDLSFRRHEANLDYGTDFGDALDWHFDSRMRGMTQAGVLSQTRLTGDEILRVELTEALQAQARYLVSRYLSPIGASTGHSGEVQLRHQLYESLTTVLSLNGTLDQITGGRTLTYGGRAMTNYTKRLPKSGSFQFGLMGAIHYSDARLPSRVQVLQEMLTFGVPFANAMALRFPRVYRSSIRIIKVARGPLPPGCPELPDGPLELHLGKDFDLRPAADPQDPTPITGIAEVFPLPCGVDPNPDAEQGKLQYNPGINPGDTIAVDYEYEYEYAPSIAYTTGAWRVDVGIDYGWIRPYFYHDQSDQRAVSGDGQYLDNKRTDTAGVEFRYKPGEQLRSSLSAEAKRFSSERQGRFDSVRCAQVITWYPILDTMVSLTGDQALIDYVEPRHRIENLSARASVSYTGVEGLEAYAMTGVLFSWDSIPPDTYTKERTINATLRARWILNMLELNAVATYYHWFRGPGGDPRELSGTLNLLGNRRVDLRRELRGTLNILRKF